jgi:hypothetical protein
MMIPEENDYRETNLYNCVCKKRIKLNFKYLITYMHATHA